MNDIYELEPVLRQYLWAGTKLKSYKETPLEAIAESWELSQLNEGHSLLYTDLGLSELTKIFSPSDFGSRIQTFSDFPLLVKLIDSDASLSIQVHPDDNYAKANENSNGKTEMWIILEAEEDSYLYLGLKADTSKEELKEKTKDDGLLDLLNKVYVKPGDIYLIRPGTIHAIGKGITLLEIQQSSNITYRLYDFNRVDQNGNKRELHLSKALDVINFHAYHPENLKHEERIHTEYFNVYPAFCKGERQYLFPDSFAVITVTEGEGTINDLKVKKYHSYIVKAGAEIHVSGDLSYVISTL